MLALLGAAFGAELGVSAGLEGVVNDPFLHRHGASLGVEIAVGEYLRFGAVIGFFPNFGDRDWKLATQLVSVHNVLPDISRITARAGPRVRVMPLKAEVGRVSTAVGAHLGVDVVYTEDDLEMLQAEGDPMAEATASQQHPGAVFGLTAEARTGRVSVRGRFEGLRYNETIRTHTVEKKNNLMVGLDTVVWF